MTNLKRTATLLGVVLWFGAALQVQAATPRVISSGQTVYCAGRSISGQINYDGTETSGAYKNTAPIIDMRANTTLTLTNAPLSGVSYGSTLCAGLIVTSGAAKVVIQSGVSPAVFLRHVIVRDKGVLTIQNCMSATFGHDVPLASANCHFYDVKNVKFATSSGGARNGTVTFAHARVLNFPDPANGVTWEAADGNSPCLWLAAPTDCFVGVNEVETAAYGPRLVVQTPEAIQAHTTVKVSDSCSFGILPAATFDTSVQHLVDTAGTRLGDDAFTGASSFSFAGGLTFENATSVLSNDFAWATALNFTGKITGDGTAFTHARGGDVASGKVTTHAFSNAGGFTGTWTVSGAPASGGALCQMSAAAAAPLPGATVIVGAGGGIVGKAGVVNAAAGKVSGTDARTARVQVASGQTMTISASSGSFAVVGAGTSQSFLNIVTCAGPTVIGDNGTATIRLNGQTPRGGARAEAYDKSFRCFALPGADGTVDVASLQQAMTGYPYLGITVDDGSVLKGASGTTTLSTEEGSSVAVDAAGGVDVTVRGGGSIALQDMTAQEGSWTNAVTYWFDFDKTNSYIRPSGLSAKPIPELLNATLKWNNHDYPVFCACVDWRYPDSLNRLWNVYWENTDDTPEHRNAYTNQVLPCYALNGIRPRTTFMVVPTGNARRIPFCTTATGSSSGNPTAVEEIIMVFGSQDGGGHAIVATSECALGRRNEQNCPFLTNNTYGVTMRVNGEEINPSTTGPNGGWQVLTIGMKGLKFNGLGFLKTSPWGTQGGQRYGEVLIFKDKIDEVARLEAEMYLAAKWKITYPRKAEAEAYIAATRWASVTNRVTASGTGTIVGGGRTLEIAGDFAGTIQLNGDKMRISESARPFTEEEIPTEGLAWWSDPSKTNTVTLTTAKSTVTGGPTYSNAVRAVEDCRTGLVVGNPFLLGTGGRTPYLVEAAHGFGPSLPWIDYYDYNDPPHTQASGGNNLRFNNLSPNYDMKGGSDLTPYRSKFPIHTAFFVQDFSRGGYGNALLDAVGGANITVRNGGKTDPIWKGKCWQFQDGETRLNGRVVDQADGVTALPEVLTVRAKDAAYKSTAGWFVGAYATSEKTVRGEMIGEILLYSNALSNAEVKGIEGYLMKKWLGLLPPGLSDLSQATVSGFGELTVDDPFLLPKISVDYAGTLVVGGSWLTLNVLIDPETDVVTGALNAPYATLDLPSSCTLNVDFSGKLLGSIAERRYPLVNCTKYARRVDWNVNLGPQVPPAWARLVREGNLIELVIDPAGFMIMVK